MLYAKVVLTVKKDKTTSDKQVVLYRGDGNVDIEFTLRSTDYVLSECVEAQLILLRPYAESVFSEIREINQNKVRFTIATDMIDELAELESYTVQIRLFGPDQVARVTLPPCYDVLEIRNPLTIEPSDEPQYITDFTFGDKDAARLNGPIGVTDQVYIYPAEEGLPMNFEVHIPDSPGWETVNYVFYNETNPYVELRLLDSTHNLEGSLRVIETYSGIEKTIPIYVRPEIRLTVHYKATDNDYTDDYLEFKMESDTAGYVHFGPAEADDYGRVGYITLKIDTVYTPELRYNNTMSMIILDDIVNLTSDTEIWISDDSTTVHYSRPRPMHTLTVHYKCTDGNYEDDILQFRPNLSGNGNGYELHLNGYSDAYGTVNVIRIREGIYHIYLEDKSPEFDVISYGLNDIVSDIEIWINDYEDEIYYENPTNPYYVEYTIDVADAGFKKVGYSYDDNTPYLPKIDDKTPTNVTIKLKDGTTTTSLDTLAKDVESIKVDYDENTQKVIFGYFADENSTRSEISGINYIYFSNKITNMDCMFYRCSSLTSLDVSNWDTSNVTSMYSMFYNCSSLTSLDVSNWDTSNVTSMYSMFDECSSLTSLDVSNWDTSNVDDMSYMFDECSSLTSLDVSNWDTSNVDSMCVMFYNCSSLTSLDLSNWDVSNVTDISGMFRGCSSLTSLDLSNWDTSNVDDMDDMFKGIPEISDWNYDGNNYTNFTLTESDTGYAGTFPWSNKVTVAKYTFTSTTDTLPTFNSEFTNYTTIDVNNGDGTTTRTIAIGKTDTLPTSIKFQGKAALLTVEELDISNLTKMTNLFTDCTHLTSVNMDEWDTSNIKDMQYMFYNCKLLTSLNLSHFNTANVTNMAYMFHSCSGLTSVDLTNWNTAKVTTTKGMFNGCTSLTSLDLSHFNTTKVTDMNKMFYNCTSLTSLDLSNWDTSNVKNTTSMFQNIPEISDWNYDGSNYTNFTLTETDTGYLGTFPWNKPDEPENPYYVEYTIDVADAGTKKVGYSHIDGTPYLPKINDKTPTNVTIKLKDGTTTTSLDTLAKDVKSIKVEYDENTQKIIFGYTHSGATIGNKISGINYIYFSNKITNMDCMFYRCSSLTSLDVSNWDTSNVMDMSGVFYYCSSLTSLDVSNWDTSNVTNMECMFYNCTSLTSLDLSNWDVSNVTNMSEMFGGCSSLTSLDASNWDTSNVTSTYEMFGSCSSLTSLDLSNWDTGNVRDMMAMFFRCSSLTSLDLSNWDTGNVAEMMNMFEGCQATIYVSRGSWTLTEEDCGFTGTFTRV